jgi:hypothetical protein
MSTHAFAFNALGSVADDTVCASLRRTVLTIQSRIAHRAVSAGGIGGRRRAFAHYQKMEKAANLRLD